ncbi:MAG: DUF3375 domain-containing protein [Arachnia propionica]|uniref:DUF3375 domain-containing protein n=1 Tax=Arachnia propionica TaxID=1750 RepID=UPI0026FC497F|nr:DUF3375 domain-containing protein [Arachnia propionica]
MSIATEVARLKEVGEGPTLRLVTHKWSWLAMAVFAQCFPQHTTSVRADRLHSQVDAHLQELASLGHELPPGAQGQGLCRSWMREGWLRRLPDDDGGEVYELTSATLAAQRVLDEMSRERALISESRLTTIVEAVNRTALDANPDREARIAALEDEIARLSAEHARLAAGGELRTATDDEVLSGYLNVRNLLSQLPGDFRRLEEEIERIHRDMIQAFRDDERPRGEILDEYLAASRELTAGTEQGRAFEGALAILSDEDLLATFRANLRAIVDHPFAERIGLTRRERKEFLAATSILRTGLRTVQERQHKASRALADHLTTLDSRHNRELGRVLRQLDQELATWMGDARPRDHVPMPWLPSRIETEHLRTRFHDPADDQPPAALEDVTGTAPPPPSLDEVRRFGGPLLGEVQAALRQVLADADVTSLGEAFNRLPEELRRPVELLGLLQVLTRLDLWRGESDETDPVTAIRPDGTARDLRLPHLRPSPDELTTVKGGTHG